MPKLLPLVQPAFIADPAIPEIRGDANSLLGRDGLLLQVKQRLLKDYSLALTALNGLPGIGKTTLAVMLARDEQVQDSLPRWHPVDWSGTSPQCAWSARTLGCPLRYQTSRRRKRQ